ncbi:MAG: hypothetical protein MUC83_08315 [Pirellula sp.]|jgi:hypothetical protein|nr:hypothetical protein [Pirellula sp.]
MVQLSHRECVRLLADAASEMRTAIASFVDPVTLDSIDQSIEQAKTAASGDLPRLELRELANAATRLTGRAELYSRGLYFDESERATPLGQLSPGQLMSVRDVADVTARSLRAATGQIESANEECQEGVSWAYALAERIGDDELYSRIEKLVSSAHSNIATGSGNHPMHTERRWWAFWEWLRRSPPPGDP